LGAAEAATGEPQRPTGLKRMIVFHRRPCTLFVCDHLPFIYQDNIFLSHEPVVETGDREQSEHDLVVIQFFQQAAFVLEIAKNMETDGRILTISAFSDESLLFRNVQRHNIQLSILIPIASDLRRDESDPIFQIMYRIPAYGFEHE
jgi:hypothetical protein